MMLSPKHASFAFMTTIVASVAVTVTLSQAASQESPPLARVDLRRIAGGWYILATIPNFLERGVVAGYDVFTPQPDGEILEDFYLRKGGFGGEAMHLSTSIEVLPNSGNADWRVHIFWPIKLPFQVLYVDPEYRYVLFGEQSRDWGWIYSRKQSVSDGEYGSMLSRFKALGYDTDRFRKFIQFPAQIGKPGYWSDGIR